jgi:hypothetical protein
MQEARMAISARQVMLREKSRLLGDMFSLMLRREALLLRLKYDPAQPASPQDSPEAGNGRERAEAQRVVGPKSILSEASTMPTRT